MQPSSAALQQRKGERGEVAILFTRLWLHDHTCVVSKELRSCILTSRSSAPVRSRWSPLKGRNYRLCVSKMKSEEERGKGNEENEGKREKKDGMEGERWKEGDEEGKEVGENRGGGEEGEEKEGREGGKGEEREKKGRKDGGRK